MTFMHPVAAQAGQYPHDTDAITATRICAEACRVRGFRDRAGGDRDLAMWILCSAFHVLRDCPEVRGGAEDGRPFDPKAVTRWGKRGGKGRQHAARFVCSVYATHTTFGLGRFDLHAAMMTWDAGNRAACAEWCREPWWA